MASRSNEKVEIEKLQNDAKARADKFQTARHLITSIMIFGIFYVIMSSLVTIAGGSASSIEQFAKVISALSLDRITAYIFGLGGAAWGVVAHQSRKGNIRRIDALSKKLEKNDEYKSSSGLTSYGETPGGEND